MASYRSGRTYRTRRTYHPTLPAATGYRSSSPYRKPDLYSGADSVVAVPPPAASAGGQLAWRRPDRHGALHRQGWNSAQLEAAGQRLLWGDFDSHVARSNAWRVRQRPASNIGAEMPWAETQDRLGESAALPWAQREAVNAATAMPFGDVDGQHVEQAELAWRALSPRGAVADLPWGAAAARAITHSSLWCSLIARGAFIALPWSPIAARSSRTIIDWVAEPDPADGTIVVPSLPVYLMLPSLNVVRLPDRVPLPVLSVSLQFELGSWPWSFTAPMSRAGLALVDDGTGSPTEIEVTINGHVWTFIVEGYDDNRRFNSNTCTLRGRSRSALLADPHAAGRTYTEDQVRTAAQLADQELAGTGWTLLWDAPDWLVPGGTFSYQDLAPLDAVVSLANSIGAAVLTDPATRQIRVAPAYPESPWAWSGAQPYAIIPAAALHEGSSSWVGGVNANGVYVYAENASSGALVKIAGSDGARQLPMVVEPLLVHPDAQRERGRAELAANGIKRRVQRTVPLFPPAPADAPEDGLGVVPPGALVEFQDTDDTWRGQVMAIRIDAQRAGSALSVRQHLTLERQYR